MDTLNILTVDVEDWYQVQSLRLVARFEDWDRYEDRVEIGTKKVLAIFDEYNVKATFFVVGLVAKRHPELIKTIQKSGHEIASHGYDHRLVYEQSPGEFANDLKKSIEVLQDITGDTVTGYRAPSWSVVNETLWALDILIENGIKYDSSIYPTKNYQFGLPGADRFPRMIKTPEGGDIFEVPPSTFQCMGRSFPFAGGFFLRALPCRFTEYQIRQNNVRDRPALVYMHPWEFDTDHPVLKLPVKNHFIHYSFLKKMGGNLREILSKFKFGSIGHYMTQKNQDCQGDIKCGH